MARTVRIRRFGYWSIMGYRPPCEKPKTRSKKAPWGNRKRSRRRRHTRKTKLSTVLSVPKIIPKILPKILPEIIPPKSFVYSPLDTNDTDAFRLLKVLPGVWDAPIQCILIHHIRSAPRIPYEALSYTWGDFNPTEEIFINGRLFLVTPNLKSALQNLRSDNMSTKGIRTLWIDAICIDQSELSERNHQVRQMQEIYAGAERVLVWLGPASGDSGTAIRFIKTVYSILTKTNSHTFASRSKFEASRFEREDFDVLDFYKQLVRWVHMDLNSQALKPKLVGSSLDHPGGCECERCALLLRTVHCPVGSASIDNPSHRNERLQTLQHGNQKLHGQRRNRQSLESCRGKRNLPNSGIQRYPKATRHE
jgi:hypothetical protein